jgi:tetratricopeptide (TPR) repeat protein
VVPKAALADVDDLKKFATMHASWRALPETIQKLVLPLLDQMTELDLPVRSGVSRHGTDATITFHGTHPMVPYGRSRWEMSNQAKPWIKANEEYRKRTEALEDTRTTTLVFVTMRHWEKKLEWAAEKRAEGVWADVRVIDCGDRHLWLSSQPEVHQWLSTEIARYLPTDRVVPAELPMGVPSFVGREDELAIASGPASLVVICGQPGIGKSTLAVHAAGDTTSGYPDGRLYLDLRGTHPDAVAPADALSQVLGSLGVPDISSARSTSELAVLYRTEASRSKFVLVLDNAKDEEQVRPLLLGESRSKVIITSRNQLKGLNTAHRIQLGVLTSDEAVQMLRSRITDERPTAEPDALDEIAALCGCLPLALAVVASGAMGEPSSWSLMRLAAKLKDERRRLDRLRAGDVEVRASLQLSYDLLTPEEQTVFGEVCLIPGPSFGCDLAGVAVAADEDDAELFMIRFVERCLAEPSDAQGRFRLHDLVRLFGKETMYLGLDAYQSPTASLRLRRHLVSHAQRSFALLRAGKDVLPTDADPSEVRRWFAANLLNVVAVLHEVDQLGAHGTAVDLCRDLCFYANAQSDWRRLDEFARLGLDITERAREQEVLDAAEAAMAESMFTRLLAESATARHDRRAASFYAAKSMMPTVPDGAPPFQKTLIQQAQASSLRLQGRYDEALELFLKVLHSWHSQGHHDQYNARATAHDIGLTLTEMGRPAEAIPYLVQDLKLTRHHGDAAEIAQSLHSLGLAQKENDQLDAAEASLAAAAEAFASCGIPIAEGAALNDLALVLHLQGRQDEACRHHLTDFNLCESLGDSEGAALALIGIANNLMSLGTDHAPYAARCLIRALQRVDSRTSGRTIGSAMASVGELAYDLGSTALGARAFAVAARAYEVSAVPNGELTVVMRHIRALSDAGFTDEARSIARRAEKLLADAPPSWLANLVENQRE